MSSWKSTLKQKISYHHTLIKMGKIKQIAPNADEHVEPGEHSLFACGMKNGTTIWKMIWQRF